MSAEMLALLILEKLLEVLGPALVRKKVDEYELARAPGSALFKAKFGEDP